MSQHTNSGGETAGAAVDSNTAAPVGSEESNRKRGPSTVIPDEPLAEWFTRIADEYADRPATYVKRNGGYEVRTFSTLQETARDVGGGLQQLGLTAGDRLAIRSETRYEWSVVDIACQLAGVVLVPVYPAFSASQSAYVIEDAGADVLVTEHPDVHGDVDAVVDEVVDVTALPSTEPASLAGTEQDVKDLATLMYTSGTTGDPKGVALTHRNLRAAMTLAWETLPTFDTPKQVTCFLPLSHIAQRVTNYSAWDQGHAPVFMSADTLLEDLKAAEPGIMMAVPRVYRRMYDGLLEEIEAMGATKARLVEWAMGVAEEYGSALEDRGPAVSAGLRARHAVAERLVFSTVRAKLGLSNVEYALTGAASLDPDVLRFFWGIGVPLLETYGATETTSSVTFNRMDGFRASTVGTPLPETEIKLADDGEVLVRGPTVLERYWNRPSETAASLTDGWYHTGDVGQWDGEYLQIIDRKKHLQVLDTGENVYSDPVEEILRRQDHIAEALLVAEDRKYATALIQPNFDAVLSFADDEAIEYDETAVVTEGDDTVAIPSALLEHPDVAALFDREVDAANRSLADYERIREYRLIPRAFSAEEEELTPTLKKRRRDIREHFRHEIDGMYDE